MLSCACFSIRDSGGSGRISPFLGRPRRFFYNTEHMEKCFIFITQIFFKNILQFVEYVQEPLRSLLSLVFSIPPLVLGLAQLIDDGLWIRGRGRSLSGMLRMLVEGPSLRAYPPRPLPNKKPPPRYGTA
jgi:hypothetical protein